MQKKLKELWPLDKKSTHTFLVCSALLFLFIFIIALKNVFTPFFLALLLAYILNPIVNLGEKFSIPRWVTTFLIFVFFSILLLIFLTVIVPGFIQEFRNLTQENTSLKQLPFQLLNDFRNTAKTYFDPNTLDKINKMVYYWIDSLHASGSLFKETTYTMSKTLLTGISILPMSLLNFLLIPFYLIFMLNSLNSQWEFATTKLIPYSYRETILRILNEIHLSLASFFRGRLIISLSIGTFTWIGFIFLDVPFPFIFGFAIGFATFIPLLGLIFLIPAIFFYWISGATLMDITLLTLFYTFIQGLEMFILTPIVLGKKVELPPLILVLSLLICGSLFGGIGVILAVPIASSAKILFYEFIFPSFIELSKKEPNSP